MDNLSKTIAQSFVSFYREYVQRVHALAESLSEEQFWKKPFPYGNSFGHLILHLSGNLSYYIGAEISNTGYVRHRDLEFTETNLVPKEELMRRFDEVVEMVIATIEKQTPETWSKEYHATGADYAKDRFSIFLRCSVHFHHHLGQMIYLVNEHQLHK